MMDFLPVRVVPLASDLPPGALADLLRGVVGDGPAAPFSGAVAADGFVITRMNEFRSTVMPLLRGSLFAKPDGGTGVTLRLRPPGTVIVVAHARDTGRSLLWLLAPAGLGALGWFLMTAVFTADARWAVEHLVESVPSLRRD